MLRHLLAQDGLRNTAVIVNELGEIGIDHLLLEEVSDQVLLLPSGCICCALRNDLVDTLRSLLDRAARGEIPQFDRVVVETTGIADPAPIVQTMMSDPLRLSRYELQGLVCTVDAELGLSTLSRYSESVRQVALADRILMTKTDRASSNSIRALVDQVRALNPAAPIQRIVNGVISPDEFLTGTGAINLESVVRLTHVAGSVAGRGDVAHHHGVQTHALVLEPALDWSHFEAWLASLVADHGAALLRIKGLLRIEGRSHPIEVHGVQHVFYRPRSLDHLPPPTRSKLTLITVGLDPSEIQARIAQLKPQAATIEDGAIRRVS